MSIRRTIIELKNIYDITITDATILHSMSIIEFKCEDNGIIDFLEYLSHNDAYSYTIFGLKNNTLWVKLIYFCW